MISALQIFIYLCSIISEFCSNNLTPASIMIASPTATAAATAAATTATASFPVIKALTQNYEYYVSCAAHTDGLPRLPYF